MKYLLPSLLLLTACNEPPRIEQVGEYLIADGVTDYLEPGYVDAPSFMVEPHQELRVQATASDLEGQPLTWSAGPLPLGAAFDATQAELIFRPVTTALYPSSMELYMVVQDPEGAWDSVVIYLSVYESSPPEESPVPSELAETASF
jgi:hypothetical protein